MADEMEQENIYELKKDKIWILNIGNVSDVTIPLIWKHLDVIAVNVLLHGNQRHHLNIFNGAVKGRGADENGTFTISGDWSPNG